MEQWKAKLLSTWYNMMCRCFDQENRQYPAYGGRGITVCDRWQIFEFYANDIGPRPKNGMHLDRIDNDQGYSPENCRWVTRQENMNNRRSNVKVEIDGVTKNLQAWADEAGMLPDTIKYRLDQGWTPQDAVNAKAYAQRNNNRIIEYDGRKGTCKQWSEWTGLSETRIRNRIKMGWTPERALTRPLGRVDIKNDPTFQRTSQRSHDGGAKIEYNGESHSCRRWSEITGLPEQAIRNRIQGGWTPEEALTRPLEKRNKRK